MDPSGEVRAAERIARLCARAPWAGTAVFAAGFAAHRRWPEPWLRLTTRMLPATDKRVLEDPEARARFLMPSSATAAKAASQDMALLARGWGFRLEDITIPVHVWQGTADFNVPLAHGEYMAAVIPTAVFHRCEGKGHLITDEYFDQIVSPLVEKLSRLEGP